VFEKIYTSEFGGQLRVDSGKLINFGNDGCGVGAKHLIIDIVFKPEF